MGEDEKTEQQKSTTGLRKPTVIRGVLVAAAIIILFTAVRVFDLQTHLKTLLGTIEGYGIPGYGVFFAVYVIACVFFIPGSVLTVGAGAVYGVVTGSILVSVSSTIGATAAFLIGRYAARDWVARKIHKNERFTAIDRGVAREGWKIVVLTRLSPVFPFNLLNYAYGLTNVSLRDYFLASWIGMMPGTVMYVYLGSLARLGVRTETATTASTVMKIVGLLATVAVTVYVTRIARSALARRMPGDATEGMDSHE